ncbi:MAG TPA: hypothetical protein VGF22_14195 [Acidimicrobiales bacterium]
MTATPTNGTRLRCPVCGTEIIVLKANEPDLACCGEPLYASFTPGGSDGTTASGRA